MPEAQNDSSQHPPADARTQQSRGARARSAAATLSLRTWTLCVRVVFWSTLAAVATLAIAVAITRFWIIPNVDDFRPRIIEALSKLTNQRVAIAGFTAGWNGWSPELRVTRLQILDRSGRTLLELPDVETTVSWRSLFTFEPRLSVLTIHNPRLVIRRSSENLLTVAGIDVDLADTTPSDPTALEWLLKQRFVQIVNGELEWHDEWRKLPPLRLRDVNLRLANSGAEHRLGAKVTPTSDVGLPFDFRATFSGNDVRKISDWDGSAYLRTDYADIAQIARYLPLPVSVPRGSGALQTWIDFDEGRPKSITTDLVLRDAQVKLGEPITATNKSAVVDARQDGAVVLSGLKGRMSWQRLPDSLIANPLQRVIGRESKSQTQRWSLRDVEVTGATGISLAPVSGELKITYEGETVKAGELRAPTIDLIGATAIANVISALLPKDALTSLREAAPTGLVSNLIASWSAAGDGPMKYAIAGDATDVSWKRGVLPGVSGLSGTLKTSESSGNFTFSRVESANASSAAAKSGVNKSANVSASNTTAVRTPLTIDFGELFEKNLVIVRASGTVSWQATGPLKNKQGVMVPGLQVTSDGIEVANDDVRATIAGQWRSDELGPGTAKLRGTIASAKATAIHEYLPTTIGAPARAWIKNAVLAGEVRSAKFLLEGSLWHFPFTDGKLGKFELSAPVTGLAIDYADRWPRADSIDGVLNFSNASFSANVARAQIAGEVIAATQVKIADIASESATVDIRGSVNSTADRLLKFVASSPVNELLDRFTENSKGSGPARLTLGLTIPIAHAEQTKLDGELTFENNRIELGGDIPALDAVNGRIRFSERDVSSRNLKAVAFGGPTTIEVKSEGNGIRTTASGRAEVARVRESYDYPLLDQLTGTIDWSMDSRAGSAKEPAALRVTGTLSPQLLPLDRVFQSVSTVRDVSQPVNFSVMRTALAAGRDQIEIELPGQLHAILERSAEKPGEGRSVDRAVVDFGAVKTSLPARGYSVRGELTRIDTDAALALLPGLTGKNAKNLGGVKTEAKSPEFINVNIKAERAIVFSHVFNDVTLRAQPSGQRWRLAIRSKEATGLISVESDSVTENLDAVQVRLQRLSFPTPATEADRLVRSMAQAAAPIASASVASSDAIRWPKLDLIAESFISDSRDLGKLEIAAQPSANEWRIDRVTLTNPDGSINAKGRWLLPRAGAAAGNGETSVEVGLDWKDAGRFMQRFGLPKGVDRAEGELKGTLSWTGSPAQFAYTKLDGQFALQTKVGRFSEMEPGIAKLLGIISLQSLPRRLTFNFDDLFGRGFAFDSISADVKVQRGKAATENFTIAGPAARVEIRGDANLDVETTQLRVRVFPSISVATAIGVGLATANPAIGAAAWLGQKIARDPVERLLMQEFDVSGAWSNPDVKQTRGMGATGSEEKPDATGAAAPAQREPTRQ